MNKKTFSIIKVISATRYSLKTSIKMSENIRLKTSRLREPVKSNLHGRSG